MPSFSFLNLSLSLQYIFFSLVLHELQGNRKPPLYDVLKKIMKDEFVLGFL